MLCAHARCKNIKIKIKNFVKNPEPNQAKNLNRGVMGAWSMSIVHLGFEIGKLAFCILHYAALLLAVVGVFIIEHKNKTHTRSAICHLASQPASASRLHMRYIWTVGS